MTKEEYRRLLAEYQSIFDSVSDGIYVTDGNGVSLRVNRAFEEITGIPANEIIGRNVQELLSSGVYNRSVSISVLETGREQSMMETLRNGKEVLLTGIPVFDDPGEDYPKNHADASDRSSDDSPGVLSSDSGRKSDPADRNAADLRAADSRSAGSGDETRRIHRIVTTLRDMAELNSLKQTLAQTVEKSERYRMELLQLRLNQIKMDNVVIVSPEMKALMRTALQLGDVDSTVLITGESGVGKEIVARAIHRAGRGEQAPLIATNCSAIPEALLESELFGYEKGAFTGAERSGKPGLFEVARNGTLFLDEIGDVSMNIQVKLLRAIHEKEILRVGGRTPIKVDVRVIAATNRDLEALVEQGSFRRDLYYRLNVIPIHIPPLRERSGAIIPLISHFLSECNRRFQRQVQFHPQTLLSLEAYPWPGNVRELENSIERLVVLADEDYVTPSQLPPHILAAGEHRNGGVIEPADTAVADHTESGSASGPVAQPPASPTRDQKHGMPTDVGAERFTGIPAPPTDLNRALFEYEGRILLGAWGKYRSSRKLASALNISQSTAVRKLARHGIGSGDP